MELTEPGPQAVVPQVEAFVIEPTVTLNISSSAVLVADEAQ
jgi:hypothetical protein